VKSSLVCEVTDTSPALPQRRTQGALNEHGLGLVIVAALADRWGTHPAQGGKAVWCELSTGAGGAA
jgi:hypothetical protein